MEEQAALTNRGEIRDAYDLEFLTRRNAGNFALLDENLRETLRQRIAAFKDLDYKVKLGSILEPEERRAVLSSRFSYLKSKLFV